MSKIIDHFETESKDIVCYYKDHTRLIINKSFANTKKLLDKMTDEHLDIREDLIDEVLKLDDIKSFFLKLSLVLFILSISTIGATTLLINTLSPFLLLIMGKTAVGFMMVSLSSYISGLGFKLKADKTYNELSKKDFVLENEEVLNSYESVEIIKDINSKLFKIMQSNKYRLLPSLNINTARYLKLKDIDVLEEELHIHNDIIGEDEEEPVYNTKIIEFRRKK